MTQNTTPRRSRKKRARTHGFRARTRTRAGRCTIARCRKGRSRLSVSEERRDEKRRR